MAEHSLLDRWGEIDAIFTRALDLPPEERTNFARAECAGDPELLTAVSELLRATTESGEFLDTPRDALRRLALADAPSLDSASPALLGERVGAYLLVEEIGRGGTGSVYRAERADGAFEQQVAVKLLRRGLDTDDILARFRAERQILASLNHPNIARLLDGGSTDDGRPFLVLELVEGQPITEYCDALQLRVGQRLRLFITAARAVQYAHRKLIVHRDLKPSNIIVTQDGTVKLLDFGIAKLLDGSLLPEASPHTNAGVRLMTPEYASPEQVSGDPITTASDIYQLGVLLYELLTGQRPYRLRGRSPRDVERAIAEQELRPPSAVLASAAVSTPADRPRGADETARLRGTEPRQLRARLRGDLDMITLKALRKEPERRYASVADLVDDIERYFGGRPVSARPDSWRYRTRKFVGRRPEAVGAALVSLLLLGAYVAGVRQHAASLEVERDRARQEAERSEQVAQILFDVFHLWEPGVQGETVTARDLLDRAAARVEQLSGQPKLQADAFSVLSDVYRRLTLYTEALTFAERALAIRRELHGAEHTDVAASTVTVAGLHQQLGSYDIAEQLYEQALAVQRRLLAPRDRELGETLQGLATVRRLKGDFDSAESLSRELLDIRRSSLDGDHLDLASALSSLGVALRMKGQFEEALPYYHEALDMRRRLLGSDHPQVALSLNNLAVLLRNRGEYDSAEALYREALEIRRRIHGNDHPDVAISLTGLGALYANKGDYESAAATFGEALEIQRRIWPAAHPNIVMNLGNLGSVLGKLGDFAAAESLLREALELERQVHGAEHPEVALAKNRLALLLTERGDLRQAEELHRRSLAMRQRIFGAEHPDIAFSLQGLAEVAAARGDHVNAESLFRQALAMRRSLLASGHQEIATTLADLGVLLSTRGDHAGAEPLLREALAIRLELLDADHPVVATTRQHLVKVLQAQGDVAALASLPR